MKSSQHILQPENDEMTSRRYSLMEYHVVGVRQVFLHIASKISSCIRNASRRSFVHAAVPQETSHRGRSCRGTKLFKILENTIFHSTKYWSDNEHPKSLSGQVQDQVLYKLSLTTLDYGLNCGTMKDCQLQLGIHIPWDDYFNNFVQEAEFSLAAGASRVDVYEATWCAGRGNVIEDVVVIVVVTLSVVAPVSLLDQHQSPNRHRTHGPKLVIGLRARPFIRRREGGGLALNAAGVVGEERAKRPVVGSRGPHLATSGTISSDGAENG